MRVRSDACSARRSDRRAPPLASRGFTLAEVVVALLLLAWGALALAAASAGAVRTVAAADSEERAALAARDRVERLATGGCTTARNGGSVDSTLGPRERWTIAASAGGVGLASDTIAPTAAGRGGRSITLSRTIVC